MRRLSDLFKDLLALAPKWIIKERKKKETWKIIILHVWKKYEKIGETKPEFLFVTSTAILAGKMVIRLTFDMDICFLAVEHVPTVGGITFNDFCHW